VPTLIDGAITLWESNAINWYLAEKHQQAGLLPWTPEGRAAVLRWAFYQTSHVSPAATAVHRSINPTHTATRRRSSNALERPARNQRGATSRVRAASVEGVTSL